MEFWRMPGVSEDIKFCFLLLCRFPCYWLPCIPITIYFPLWTRNIAVESMVSSTRVAGGTLFGILVASGQGLLGVIAWIFPYWRTFLQAIYGPAFVMLGYLWLIEESNRWLLSQQRYQEVAMNVKKIAKTNGTELSDEILANLNYNIKNKDNFGYGKNTNHREIKISSEEKEKSPFEKLIRSKILLIRILKCCVWWMTCTFCFYGMSISAVVLAGNIYTNYIVTGLVEIPGHILGFFALRHFGRKKTIFVSFLIPGLCLLAFTFIPEDMHLVSLISFLVGKMCIGLAFVSIYLYTSELFPTPLRHSALAFCSMIGRLGSVAAPQTPLLALYLKELPSYLFAGTCLLSAMLILTVPETFKCPLPETIEEAESIGLHKSKKAQNDIHLEKITHL